MANESNSRQAQSITAITVSGFKSLRDESRIEVRPLTILAGANSSGKSSVMQPLLLMKQTCEAQYDPGPLLLDGPNVHFTSSDQLFNKFEALKAIAEFTIALENAQSESLVSVFEKMPSMANLVLSSVFYRQADNEELRIWSGMQHEQISNILPEGADNLRTSLEHITGEQKVKWSIDEDRCFLLIGLRSDSGNSALVGDINFGFYPIQNFKVPIQEVIHVPGLRGNPKRTYLSTPIAGPVFPGTFENYLAGVIRHWSETKNSEVTTKLLSQLSLLGLTSSLGVGWVGQTEAEIRVGRTLKSDETDLVSIADVGFGVSQALPVLVALLVAEPGQLVYIEQPELHLHPRAQVALAQVLADAANRGVRVVAETHSDLLLLGLQTLVAEGKLPPDIVKLHWFERDEVGVTHITSSDVEEDGAFENWPEDFSEVTLKAQSRYLDAAEAHHIRS